ncbi:uncharacterized mitochondrial protein AtMg00310-like [Salvia miltiorrhiza]|uniref:uncharacterized mitochondrial protein AtMg00310-like n=1 Tax=Salvia miltiorrhiza TaxID=226208 RepID=UPI0025AD9AE9|nr:uncharacterized mitochondrial protein AtMg00310-like [Salvia miltiorrhiza]
MEWAFLNDKIKSKINGWKKRKISFTGRATLIRSVLLSIPIYHLSFSKFPKCVVDEIQSYFSKFLWGGGLEDRKIHWVKWDDLCVGYGLGGLNFKNLNWFNTTLMAKWIWRFLVDKHLLWAKAVRACHGEFVWENGGLDDTNGKITQIGWWKIVLGISRGDDGKWLRDNVEVVLGEGDSLSFWHDWWIGEGKLSEKFPRLFRISNNKHGTVKSMGIWVEGTWRWNLEWSREPRGREHDQIQSLISIINCCVLRVDKRDGWSWKASSNGVFSIKSAYEAIS